MLSVVWRLGVELETEVRAGVLGEEEDDCVAGAVCLGAAGVVVLWKRLLLVLMVRIEAIDPVRGIWGMIVVRWSDSNARQGRTRRADMINVLGV